MKTTYLLTGGNGNLARQLAVELKHENSLVILFDISSPDQRDIPVGCEYVQGDITDQEVLLSLFEKYRPNVVLHMASLLSGSSETDRRRAWEINAGSSFNLLELSLKYGVKCFFFPSTVVTYGKDLVEPLPEDFPQWPESIYGATKVAVERAGHYFHTKHGLNFRSVRLPFVISAYAPKGALTAYASHVYREAVEGRPFVFPVKETTAVSTIYVKDVIRGILQFIQVPDEKLTRRVYNVHGFSPGARSIASAIQKILPGFSFSFSPDPAVLAITNGIPVAMIDQSARDDWGWNPRYSLETMTEDFINELSTTYPS